MTAGWDSITPTIPSRDGFFCSLVERHAVTKAGSIIQLDPHQRPQTVVSLLLTARTSCNDRSRKFNVQLDLHQRLIAVVHLSAHCYNAMLLWKQEVRFN